MAHEHDLDEAMIAELRRVAAAPARSGREAQAKVAAIRTLERLGRRKESPLPDFRTWHPGGPFEDLDTSCRRPCTPAGFATTATRPACAGW